MSSSSTLTDRQRKVVGRTVVVCLEGCISPLTRGTVAVRDGQCVIDNGESETVVIDPAAVTLDGEREKTCKLTFPARWNGEGHGVMTDRVTITEIPQS